MIALQETHIIDDADLKKRDYIAGYLLLDSINHKQYGIATYVKEDIDELETVHKEVSQHIHVLLSKIGEVTK